MVLPHCRRLLGLSLLFLAVLSLSGCGQKGPLYLPNGSAVAQWAV